LSHSSSQAASQPATPLLFQPESEPALAPSWKQEVNRRIAAHHNRKAQPASAPPTGTSSQHSAGGRAAEIRARVAARYANAPSYGATLFGEVGAAVEAAEAASHAALEAAHHAQAAAESLLAEFEAVVKPEPPLSAMDEFPVESSSTLVPILEPVWEPMQHPAMSEVSASPLESHQTIDRDAPQDFAQSSETEHEPETAAPSRELGSALNTRRIGVFEVSPGEWHEPGPRGFPGTHQASAPDRSTHANLIEFPRELAASRKVRPRLAEGPLAAHAESNPQLSIFEVDPASISTAPEPVVLAVHPSVSAPKEPARTNSALHEQAARASVRQMQPSGPISSGIRLGEQTPAEIPAQTAVEETLSAVASAAPENQASVSLRLMAAVVDLSLVAGACLAAVATVAANAQDLPGLREIEIGAALGFVGIAALYLVLFTTLCRATPGMLYAGIEVCTFQGVRPTRAERCRRLGALMLSMLPVGLGIAWILIDKYNLTWHDRLSQTYLRKPSLVG
jgi:uncharacterized RDD family membrane protein YckC